MMLPVSIIFLYIFLVSYGAWSIQSLFEVREVLALWWNDIDAVDQVEEQRLEELPTTETAELATVRQGDEEEGAGGLNEFFDALDQIPAVIIIDMNDDE